MKILENKKINSSQPLVSRLKLSSEIRRITPNNQSRETNNVLTRRVIGLVIENLYSSDFDLLPKKLYHITLFSV